MRHGALALAALGAIHIAPVRAADGAPPEAEKRVLPGQIYVQGGGPGGLMRGLLKIDPNERTCTPIEQTVTGPVHVAPGGRRVVFFKRERPAQQTGTMLLLDLETDRDPRPAR